MASQLTASEASRLRELLFEDDYSDADSVELNIESGASEGADVIGDVDLATLLADIEDSAGQVARHQVAMDEQARELLLLKASLEEDMLESIQHRERLMAMRDLYRMRDDVATLHEQRLELRSKIAAAELAESHTVAFEDTFGEKELDSQFDSMLKQIIDMRETLEQLSIQKQLLERDLVSASSDILGRFANFSSNYAHILSSVSPSDDDGCAGINKEMRKE
jgi:hypothetical protein